MELKFEHNLELIENFPLYKLGRSVWTMSKIFGIQGNTRKKLSKTCEQTCERASNWIWLKRNDVSWIPL